MSKIGQAQVNPAPIVVVAVLLVLALGYFFWLKPSMDEARIKREWATPEAAAKRGPGKQMSPEYEAKVRELLAKEGRQRGAPARSGE